MNKLDGLGHPIDPEGLYYIQDTRSVVGNCALWWAVGGHGYTCDLVQAGKFLGSELGARDTDVPWPEEFVSGHIVHHVRVEPLNRAKAGWK